MKVSSKESYGINMRI
jgi:hypothetical protein